MNSVRIPLKLVFASIEFPKTCWSLAFPNVYLLLWINKLKYMWFPNSVLAKEDSSNTILSTYSPNTANKRKHCCFSTGWDEIGVPETKSSPCWLEILHHAVPEFFRTYIMSHYNKIQITAQDGKLNWNSHIYKQDYEGE